MIKQSGSFALFSTGLDESDIHMQLENGEIEIGCSDVNDFESLFRGNPDVYNPELMSVLSRQLAYESEYNGYMTNDAGYMRAINEGQKRNNGLNDTELTDRTFDTELNTASLYINEDDL
jgi:hypothetical protein